MSKKKNKGGRPPLSAEEKANRVRVSATIFKGVSDELEAAAEKSGRSTSAELAHWLENSKVRFTGVMDVEKDAAAAIAAQIKRLTRNLSVVEGDLLFTDPNAHTELTDAINVIVNCYGPDGGIPTPTTDETPGQRRGRSMLTQYYEVKKTGLNDDSAPDERRMAMELDLLPQELWEKLEPKK